MLTTHDDADPWTDCDCWYCTAQRIIWREGAGNRRQIERRGSAEDRRTQHTDKEEETS